MNSSIPPELQLEVFKKLDPYQTVKLRRVCVQWMDLINQARSLWRRVTILDQRNLKSIIDLFNKQSGGTIEEIILQDRLTTPLGFPLLDALAKSKSTLTTISFYWASNSWKLFLQLIKLGFHNLTDFRDCRKEDALLVKVTRRTRLVNDQEDIGHANRQEKTSSPTPLQVLWIDDCENILEDHPEIFVSLVSLKFRFSRTPLWNLLPGLSKTLKHLSLVAIRPRDLQPSSQVYFPNLQVLELGYDVLIFPHFMIVPSKLKLFTSSIIKNLPPISELYTRSFKGYQSLKTNCPELEVLGSSHVSFNRIKRSEQTRLLELMMARKKNVKDGVECKGIKMKQLRNLIIPLRTSDVGLIKALRRCTEEVIDVPELGHPIIELEV